MFIFWMLVLKACGSVALRPSLDLIVLWEEHLVSSWQTAPPQGFVLWDHRFQEDGVGDHCLSLLAL